MRPIREESDRHDSRDLEASARAGDSDARGEVLEANRAGIIRFCHRYLDNLSDAEDVAQEVIARLVTGAPWPQGPPRPFLLRMARNSCLDSIRRRQDGRVGAGSFLGFARPASQTGPSTMCARDERDERLRDHLLALPMQHCEVLFLRYFEDLSRLEIAEVLDLPASVVKSRLFEARSALRKRIGDGWI